MPTESLHPTDNTPSHGYATGGIVGFRATLSLRSVAGIVACPPLATPRLPRSEVAQVYVAVKLEIERFAAIQVQLGVGTRSRVR